MASARPSALSTGRLFDDGLLKFLPAPLREPRRAWLAILTGWLLSIVGSLALAALSRMIVPELSPPVFPMTGAVALFLLVIFAPLVETLIMGAVLELLLRLRIPPAIAILLSASGWGIAHSLQALGWGLVIWWPFLIFSTLYVVWRQRGIWTAVGIAATTHALQNLGPALLVAFG